MSGAGGAAAEEPSTAPEAPVQVLELPTDRIIVQYADAPSEAVQEQRGERAGEAADVPEADDAEVRGTTVAGASVVDLRQELPAAEMEDLAAELSTDPAVVRAESDHRDLSSKIVGGYDFLAGPSGTNDGDGRDPDYSDPGAYGPALHCETGYDVSSNWHGTHVAGMCPAIEDAGTRGASPLAWGSPSRSPTRTAGTGRRPAGRSPSRGRSGDGRGLGDRGRPAGRIGSKDPLPRSRRSSAWLTTPVAPSGIFFSSPARTPPRDPSRTAGVPPRPRRGR